MRDAITAAWLRRVDRRTARAVEPATDLESVLREEGVAPRAPQLPASPSGELDPVSRLRGAMEALAARAAAVHDARMEELAFLANVLSAGARIEERRVRSIEAVELALEACARGLARRSSRPEDDADVLAARSLDLLFRDGYGPRAS